MKWICSLLGHVWAYAEGDKGTLCFRRACTRCGKIQEISHYSWLPPYIGADGVGYRQKPVWINGRGL